VEENWGRNPCPSKKSGGNRGIFEEVPAKKKSAKHEMAQVQEVFLETRSRWAGRVVTKGEKKNNRRTDVREEGRRGPREKSRARGRVDKRPKKGVGKGLVLKEKNYPGQEGKGEGRGELGTKNPP